MIKNITHTVMVVVMCAFSCQNGETIQVKGLVNKVGFNHLGKGNYSKVVDYEYIYSGIKYNSQETFTFNWQGNYKKGDSVKIKINSIIPSESKIVGKVLSDKKNLQIKLESRK